MTQGRKDSRLSLDYKQWQKEINSKGFLEKAGLLGITKQSEKRAVVFQHLSSILWEVISDITSCLVVLVYNH